MLGQLVVTQIKDADIVAISKVDAVDEASKAESAGKIRELNEKAEILYISSFTGEGLDQLLDRIVSWKG